MCFLSIAANIDHRLPQALGETGLPIGSSVIIGQIGEQKSTATYLVLDYCIDVASLLRDCSEFEPGISNGLLEAFFVESV